MIEMAKSHPPLIHDPFHRGREWIKIKLESGGTPVQMIDLGARNPDDLVTIEKSFQSDMRTLYLNCAAEIDSILLPLVYYKNASSFESKYGESTVVIFANRRLICQPVFQMYFETCEKLHAFSPDILCATTPISYMPSIENLIEQFELALFEQLFPDEFQMRTHLFALIRECNEKLRVIDTILKEKWEMYISTNTRLAIFFCFNA